MELKRLSFKHKNSKILYYVKNRLNTLIPTSFFQKKLNFELKKIENFNQEDVSEILNRVAYYNKLETSKLLNEDLVKIKDFKIKGHKKVYFYDFYEYLKFFNPLFKVKYLFGDITKIPNEPSFVKSRPINGDNENSVVLKWNKIRHFITIKNEKNSFREKQDKLVFRGRLRESLPNRVDFVAKYINHPLCDVGDMNKKAMRPEWKVDRMTIDEQLEYKFILSLEGNDVATNLKWIMSSNSVVVMPKPKFETWYMEGTLIPDHHYILIEDDYSDLESKLNYYIENPDKAEAIIKNANEYAANFRNKEKEDLISLMVINKYFEKTNQL